MVGMGIDKRVDDLRLRAVAVGSRMLNGIPVTDCGGV
jgi:hypothetical protein